MKIIYLHHAHRAKAPREKRTQDEGLTEIGKKDAQLMGELLKTISDNINISQIYTSEFFRCTETASIVNNQLHLPITIEPRLNEFRSVAGETWVDCQNRVTAAIKDILDTHEDDDAVICVTSGVNVAAFISLAYKIPVNENVPLIYVPSCSPLVFEINKQ